MNNGNSDSNVTINLNDVYGTEEYEGTLPGKLHNLLRQYKRGLMTTNEYIDEVLRQFLVTVASVESDNQPETCNQPESGKALNDPTVSCCGRDAANCDCPDKSDDQCESHKDGIQCESYKGHIKTEPAHVGPNGMVWYDSDKKVAPVIPDLAGRVYQLALTITRGSGYDIEDIQSDVDELPFMVIGDYAYTIGHSGDLWGTYLMPGGTPDWGSAANYDDSEIKATFPTFPVNRLKGMISDFMGMADIMGEAGCKVLTISK